MKKEKKIDAVSTFLGPDAVFDGTINGTVIIGDKATVEAEISVETVIIKGSVSGRIQARDRIEAYPPARILGELQAPTIAIDSGVVFNGNCSMENTSGKDKKTT